MMRFEGNSSDDQNRRDRVQDPDLLIVPVEPTVVPEVEQQPLSPGSVEEVLHDEAVKRWLDYFRNGGSN